MESKTLSKYDEERFSLALKGAKDGIWDWNLDTNHVYYSPGWASMLGYEADEVGASIATWESLVHPDDRGYVLERVQEYISEKISSFEVEMRMRHKDGHWVYVLSRAFLSKSETDDHPSRLVGTHVDITARKVTEQANRETSNILEMIATGEPANFIYDAIARLYEPQHFGMRCSTRVLDGTVLKLACAPNLPTDFCDAIREVEYGPGAASCGVAAFTGETEFVEDIESHPGWQNIKQFALPHGLRSCASEPIKDASGKVLGVFSMYFGSTGLPSEQQLRDLRSAARLTAIVINRDHSENEIRQHRQNLEELVSIRTRELEAAKKAAEKASQAKSEFLSLMSHELRTPLNAILGFSQVLEFNKMQPLTEAQKISVSNIRESGTHLLELISDVLDLAKIESDNFDLSMEHLMPSEVFRECLELMRPLASKRQVTMSGKPGAIEGVYVDRRKFKQIVLNLLSNAIKYNRPGGEVNFGCEKMPGDNVRIFVSDTGTGIPDERHQELYQPFNRLGREASDIEGTGVGLAITKQLVEAMGGEIRCESKIDEGTTFWMIFPESQPGQHS